MPKKVKKFIDKKNAVTYALMARPGEEDMMEAAALAGSSKDSMLSGMSGMTAKQRRDTLSMWEGGDASDAPVMIATKAFGLGIDRPDVSLVVQMGLADDIAEWWQMSGRAARSEGARGLSVTFVHPRFVTERLSTSMT